jgi:DNA excision repair protein ERCC-4
MSSPKLRLVDPAGTFMVPVVVDTREQIPLTFEGMLCDAKDGGGPLTVPTVRGTLQSGDYSLRGFEMRVACERKSLSDCYGTIGQGRDRFERELARLDQMEFAAVIIEATWEELCSEPPPHTQLPPKTVFRSVLAWTVRYPRVRWLPCGPRRLAEVTTFRLLEKWLQANVTQEEVAAIHATSGPDIQGAA